MCSSLIRVLGGNTVNITDYSRPGARPVVEHVAELHDTTYEVIISVATSELNVSKVDVPEQDAELLSMFFDRRFKNWDPADSGGWGFQRDCCA